MREDLPVISVIHSLTAAFEEGAEEGIFIKVTGRLPEGELLLTAASVPHAQYWCSPVERTENGLLRVSMEGFSAVCGCCADIQWKLAIGRKTAGGVYLYPLERKGKASYVRKLDAYFCDDRRRYLPSVYDFRRNDRSFSVLPCYIDTQYLLSLLVTPSAARFERQLSCRLSGWREEKGILSVTVLCPKTMEQPAGLLFHGEEGETPVFPAASVGEFAETHSFTAEIPANALKNGVESMTLCCAVGESGGEVLYCPVRLAAPKTAAAIQSRYEENSLVPEVYLSVNEEHCVVAENRRDLLGTQYPNAKTLGDFLNSKEYRTEGGITALSLGGENWHWRLHFPNADLIHADECGLLMEKIAAESRIFCSVTAEPAENGTIVTADLSPLTATLENSLYSDWTAVLCVRRGNAFYAMPVLDPLHTYYDAHDFQTDFNFTSDLNRQPVGTIELFGRTIEGCPHWVRKQNTRLCFRMCDQTLRYMTSFTCRADWAKLHFGVFSMKVRCPKIDGKWTGFVITHRMKLEEDRMTYELPLKSLKDCGDYYEAVVSIPVKKLEFKPLYWDLRMVFEQDGMEFWCSVKAPPKLTERSDKVKNAVKKLFFGESVRLNKENQLFLYRTAYNRFSLVCQERTEYSGFLFRLKERLALVLYFLLKKSLSKQAIMLVYEKYCCMAQDNGFYFFQYCMENNMEQELNRKIYFVIDKNSADYRERLLPYQNHVIPFMSLKHMVYLLGCRLMVSSDSKAHAYAWRCKESIIQPYVEKNRRLVFLQHGVIALKKVDFFSSGTNTVDLFVTSNQREHDIIVNELGYQPHEVIITGLARWDVMQDRSAQQSPKSILIMPTWRNWLEEVSDETFRHSDYYQNYMALLNSERLEAYLEEHDLQLQFYIHPKFREYIGNFSISGDRVRLIPFGTEPLNELMMECSMLITDYSSVCWDVYHQGKPVLFYQFDLAKYNETQGAYIDMETELFGDRATTPDQLFELMEEAAQNGFRLKQKYAEMRPTMYKYLDRNNSKRVLEEIRKRNW